MNKRVIALSVNWSDQATSLPSVFLSPSILVSFLSQICLLSCYKYEHEDVNLFGENSPFIACLGLAWSLGSILSYRCHPLVLCCLGFENCFLLGNLCRSPTGCGSRLAPHLSWQRKRGKEEKLLPPLLPPFYSRLLSVDSYSLVISLSEVIFNKISNYLICILYLYFCSFLNNFDSFF